MIKATRNGIAAIFSDNDWKSGQPQRYGWQEAGKEGKTLPKEIINFIERRKAPEPEKVEKPDIEKGGIIKDTQKVEIEGGETVIASPPSQIRKLAEKKMTAKFAEAGKKAGEKQSKTKANDNPKQKGRASGKHKPGAVEKA